MPCALAPLALMVALSSAHGTPETREVAFRYVSDAPLASAVVVGGFNEWDRARHPLAPDPARKVWTGRFRLPVGVYPYLFCLDNARWVPDPSAPSRPDGNGNANSLLVVAPPDYDLAPGALGDGRITRSALGHRPDASDTVRLDARRANLFVRTRRGDVARVFVRTAAGDHPARRTGGDELYDLWRAEIPLPRDGRYVVLAEDGGPPVEIGRYRQAFARIPLPRPPEWLRDAVFYGILPDRFANGDPTNDGPGVQPWGSPPTHEGRMGGDLAGIRANLAHLSALGANAVYLNPVFVSPSNHGYDTDDYERVDPRFGTNAGLKALVADAHARGVRVILDGVFNHSSPRFFAFRDLLARGADSPYRDWYFPLAYPLVVGEGQRTYRTFAGVPNMPKLDEANPATRDYFVGIGRKWVREAGIDGWRLDVADEIEPGFLRAFRQGVRAERRDAYLLGETWGDAHTMIQGDAMDASMNYRWRDATLRLVNRQIALAEYVRLLEEIDATTPVDARWATFNLLGSHDTERLRTVLGGSEAKHRLAAAVQFFSPGAPMILYGDEYGHEGGKEPASRVAMPRDPTEPQKALMAFYAKLAALRRELAPSRRKPFSASVEGGLLVLRYGEGEDASELVLNVGDAPVERPTDARRVILHERAELSESASRIESDGFVLSLAASRKG